MSLYRELNRRNVFRVGAAYIVAAWLLIQVAETIFPLFGFGDTPARVVVIVLAIGFPLFLVFSWVFEITPEGLKKEKDVDRTALIAHKTGKQLDRIIMVMLALALGYFAFDKFVLDPARDAELVVETAQQARSEALVESYGDKSIAVLPFVNLSSDPEQEYFSDGISEELLNLLAKIPELRVIAQTSSFSYKGKDIKIADVARELNVGHVLEGSVRKAGNQVRITAQLNDARSETHLWSATFDRKLENIFAIQDEIAAEVVRQLEITLMNKPLPRARATSLEAHEAYLLGMKRRSSLNVEDLAASMEYFRTAINHDPNYVEAYIALARDIFFYIMMKGPPQSEQQVLKEHARTALQTALKLDNRSAAAITLLGGMEHDHELKIQSYRRALQLKPNYPLAYLRLAAELRDAGNLEEAVDLFRELLELDPLNANTHSELGFTLWNLGRDDEAMAEIRKSMEIEPMMVQNHAWQGGRTEEETGRVDKSMVHYRKAYSLDPEAGMFAAWVARSYAHLGADLEAFAWLDHAVQQSPGSSAVQWIAIVVNWRLGHLDSAMKHAERLLAMDNNAPERFDANAFALFLLSQRDIGTDRTHVAIDRWLQAYPYLNTSTNMEVNSLNFLPAMFFARTLLQAGKVDEGRRLLQSCLERSGELYKWRESNLHWRRSVIYVLLEQKEDALNSLQREVEDGHHLIKARNFLSWYNGPEYDFLRDDPEFRQLVQTVETDLTKQLERVREMERNGELAPALGVMIESNQE